MAFLFAIAGFRVGAQSTSPAPSSPQTGPAVTQENAPPQQKPGRVTTTVVVHGEVKDDYLSEAGSNASLDNTPLAETPLSVTEITSGLMSDQISRVLSDLIKNDASVGEDYAPVGYYGDYEIRGFPVDLATGLQINGLTIAGEQDVPLENKQRVEIIKGIAGVESGIASAGGVIDYATREPYAGLHRSIDLATDHRGSSYGSTEFLVPGARGSSGVLITAAAEDIHTYVEGANGWRGMGAADGRWQLGTRTLLMTDFDYQHKVQRSEAGYQLLGGTTVPAHTFPSVMLGYQPWSKPNTFDTFNAGARLQHDIAANWNLRLSGSYSHSLIDDNVIWPYGPALDADGNNLCPDAVPSANFFCPDGSYEIYDYRSPGELRIDAVGEALLLGHFTTGSISHDIAGGGSIFHRSVDLSTQIVYQPLGVENLFQPNILYAPDNLVAAPSQLADFNHQGSGIIQERAHLPGRIVLQAGGRFADVSDFNYSNPRSLWLPQYAVTYSPQSNLTLYANYGSLLSLGPQAPWWVDNSSLFLTPFMTRQSEIGAKYERGILVTGDYFRMRQPFFYPRIVQGPDNFCSTNLLSGGSVVAGDQCFESAGHETHDGVELNAQGKSSNWMQLSASATAMRAVANHTGTPAFDDKQVINVPRFHTAFFADVLVPHARGLRLMPGWSYSSRKEATRDDAVSVGGYNLFNLGARYTPGGENGRLTFRMYADNILNKRYWKDTGASYGDTFIHLGAPTTVRLSAHYTF